MPIPIGIEILEVIGTFFFCLSGALAGRQKDFDPWGVFVLALITGTGGGTLRSLLLDLPVPIINSPVYVIVAAVTVPCALFPNFWKKITRHVSIIDAVGLGLFAGVGTQIALEQNLAGWAAIGMGVVSATFGGVLRDIIRNDIPLVFRREVYATAAIFGSSICYLGQQMGLSKYPSIVVCIVVTAAIRLVALHFAIHKAEVTDEAK